AITTFARSGNGGLIVTGSALAMFHRDLIVMLAARHKLPAVYYRSPFVNAGGLISYGASGVDNSRRAASYVDRILKGEKPADLPVQAPTKYDLVLNLKTAKALGLTIPETLTRLFNETPAFHRRSGGDGLAAGGAGAAANDARDRISQRPIR